MDRENFAKILKEVLEDYLEEETAEEAAYTIYERCDEEGLFEADTGTEYD